MGNSAIPQPLIYVVLKSHSAFNLLNYLAISYCLKCFHKPEKDLSIFLLIEVLCNPQICVIQVTLKLDFFDKLSKISGNRMLCADE